MKLTSYLVVASALDSILDILSGSVLFIIEKIKNRYVFLDIFLRYFINFNYTIQLEKIYMHIQLENKD